MYHYKVNMALFEEKMVYDGDTLRLYIDLGFSQFTLQKLRLSRINAPEMRVDSHNKGVCSRDFLRSLLKEAKEKGKEVTVKTIKDRKGKYGRYLAELFFDDLNVNDFMLLEGMAKPY